MRRLRARPSGVAFDARGWVSPRLTADRRSGPTPPFWSRRTTRLARAPASSQFVGNSFREIGTLSVCPRTTIEFGTRFTRSATFASTSRPPRFTSAEPLAKSTSCVRLRRRPSRSCSISIWPAATSASRSETSPS